MRSLLMFIILSCSIPGFLLQYHRYWYPSYIEGTLCQTPDFIPGACMKLPKCPTIYNRFTHPEYLLRAHRICGETYVDDSPLVCCSPHQRPQIDKRALYSAEQCINSASQRGVCMPSKSCESLYIQSYIKIPKKTEKCDEGSNLICCPLLNHEFNNQIPDNEMNSVKLYTMEDGCGETFVKKRVKRIIGGQTSKIGNWPWIALLVYSGMQLSVSCAGALISERHVLTAAHCLKASLQFVRLGEHDLSDGEETDHLDVQVAESVPHPEYNLLDSLYDIAVIHLHKTVVFTNFISPICLPLTSELQQLSKENIRPFITGWGRTMERGSSATILQNIQVHIYNNSLCKNLYKKQKALKSAQQFSEVVLCTGDLDGGKDACKGDSGGPIMAPVPFGDGERYVLIGLVSYGIGCGRKGIPSVNTNVMSLLPWIKDRVAEMQ